MWSAKFFQNQHNNQRNHQTNFPNFELTSAELYPRRRRTEFYYEASIPEEYQSRSFEHPTCLNSRDPHRDEKHKKEKIIVPKNSAMRMARDSYFS